MKVYISLPISGHDIDEVKRRAETVKERLQESGHEVITPFDVCTEEGRSYAYNMGKDIEALLECEAIYMDSGWHRSRGCMAEFEVAKVYGKEIINI